MRRAIVFLGAALCVAGCGNDSDRDAGSNQPSSAATAEATLSDQIQTDDAVAVALEDRLVREITLDQGPDWMVEAFGSLWVKEDFGDVIRVDPKSGEVLAEIPDGKWREPTCQGIGASSDAVWSCPSPRTLARIDPETDQLEATVKIDKTGEQGRLPSTGDKLWLLTDGGERLTALDTNTNEPAEEIELPGACSDLAGSGGILFVSCYSENLVVRVDPAAGEVTDELEIQRPRAMALGQDLFVGTDVGLAQIDPETFEVEALYDTYLGVAGRVFASAEDVWVREDTPKPFLTHIDPVAHEVIEVIETPELKTTGDVVMIGDSVWVAAVDDEALVQLRAR
jgi:streptogramin lyase